MRRKLTILCAAIALASMAWGQSLRHEQSETYVGPSDSLVIDRLQQWQGLKFGIILHWGLYSVPGIVESWQLTSEDWITPHPTMDYDEFKRWYWGLIDMFNPVDFDPQQWADISARAGAKYVIFTSKHHDGFCLFDSKQTDFTVMHSPFGADPRADVLRHVFDAYRDRGLKVGCYFSKPDWHSEYYWWPKRSTYNRRHNYDERQYPERWRAYQDFVYRQAEELMTGYGPIDIFWLDGGWCEKPIEDIRLDSIVGMARSHQPGLIVVNRACPGPYEDYQTPEQKIPDHQITTPWESCITLTNDWGWTPRPVYKSANRIISTLAEIVAKGGSLLLGIGPTPQGLIAPADCQRLEEIGRWLEANGEAIYGTVPTPVYANADGNVWFTASADGEWIYGIVTAEDGAEMPTTVAWQGNTPKRGTKVTLLTDNRPLKHHTSDTTTTLTLPTANAPLAFKIKRQ